MTLAPGYYLLRPIAGFATWPLAGSMPGASLRVFEHFRREIESGASASIVCSRDGSIVVCLALRDMGFLLAETDADEVSHHPHESNGLEAVFSLWLEGGNLLDD